MRFYIASRLENVDNVRRLKAELESRGHVHTHDWTKHGSVQHMGNAAIRNVSVLEVDGVRHADWVIVLLPGGRGTHTEMGIAIGVALHRYSELDEAWPRIVVVSETPEQDFGDDGRTCAFYHHPLVRRVSSMRELLAYIDEHNPVGR